MYITHLKKQLKTRNKFERIPNFQLEIYPITFNLSYFLLK